jgi:hypothetical protein
MLAGILQVKAIMVVLVILVDNAVLAVAVAQAQLVRLAMLLFQVRAVLVLLVL